MYTKLFKSGKSLKGYAHLAIIRGSNNLPDYEFISLNENFAAFTGKKVENLKGNKVSKLFPKDDNFSAVFDFDFTSVALKCAEINEEVYICGSDKWYSVYAFSTAHKEFNLIVSDITADKYSKDLFFKESQLLQSLLSTIPVMITIYDPDLKNIIVNKEFEKVTGWSQDEVNKGNILEQSFPDPEYRKRVIEFMKKGEGWLDEEMIIKNGSTIQVTWANTKLPEGRTAGIGVNITERKKIEEMLRSNEAMHLKLARNLELESAKLQTIISELPAGVVIGAPSGEILSMNKVGLQLHGFNSEEEMFSRLDKYVEEFELLQSDGTPLPFESWPAARGIKGDFIRDLEVVLHNRKLNTRKYVSYSTAGVKDSKGNITHLIYVIYDLTERKQAEEALKNSEENLRELTDKLLQTQKLALMGSIETFPGNNKVVWSDSVFDIFELDKNNGMPDMEYALQFVHPEDRHETLDKIEEAMGKKEKIEVEFRLLLKSGKIKYVNYIINPIIDNKGNYLRRLGAIVDITERKNAQKRLEEAYHEKEVLLRELYHRTKNNMQVVCSLLGLKSNSFINTKVEAVFTDMQNRIRAIALVHEKLYQSQNLSRVNLKEYIVDLVHLLFNSHQVKKGVVFRHDLEEINVLIDTAVPVGLILTELILNSIKYAFPGDLRGHIEVSLKHMEDHSILITISDNGIGFKETDMESPDKLGLQLVRTIGENQLNGEVSVNFKNGVSWSIKFKDNSYTERI